MPKIIQFTHPGIEHGPDAPGGDSKSWNSGDHRRKFMMSKGDHVAANGSLVSDKELIFWGEWEPPSKVEALGKCPDKFHPRWLHSPYLPSAIPSHAHLPGSCSSYSTKRLKAATPSCKADESICQNTDPFVFGDCFKYFVCKQWSQKTGRSTGLATLDKGSVILFGSTSGRTATDAFFQLDTVFVVGSYLEYRPCDPASLPQHPSISPDYLKAVFRMAFAGKNPDIPSDLKLRLYLGATCANPENGMYSFAPARVAGKTEQGFPRVALKDLPYLTNNLNSAPKSTDAAAPAILQFWQEIRDISRKHGCVKGVSFTYDKCTK